MRTYEVSFTLSQDYLQGFIEVEAASKDEAVDKVEQEMDIDTRMEHTSETEWSVDAWSDQ